MSLILSRDDEQRLIDILDSALRNACQELNARNGSFV